MNDKKQKSTILVVDDEPANIHVLMGTLKNDYAILAATNGQKALEFAARTPTPDLILLDIMMPEMDGYEVCRRLKENPDTSDIPVIFITAMTEIENKTKGFELGAVDYITKPFDPREVEIRVRTHITFKHAKEELERHHQVLKQSYSALQKAETARDSLTHMIVHDMRTPLNGIQGYIDMILILHKDKLDESILHDLKGAKTNASKLIEMVSSLLDLNRLESGQMPVDMKENDLVQTIRDAVLILGIQADYVNLIFEPGEDQILGSFDVDLTRRIIVNLLSNAIKFTPKGDDVLIEIKKLDTELEISIIDSGPGIPIDLQQIIFEKFGQAEVKKSQKGYSSGIGLAFCKMAVEAHGCQIDVDSELGKGSRFFFRVPLRD
ncbi:MAG: hybrid sensor histidine kinase/response regulator [Calditrichaeota bacterium]|nr:hybrid sensor histidine kinase/response regulator [Calditrichota bacterium]MBT5426162.1 hybrid sensor histidine kinase/response regulator [Bacteroidota bacterium]MBT7619094.1 hybrid sensor histidine kinase/response regulator [Calditrichota bacterium]